MHRHQAIRPPPYVPWKLLDEVAEKLVGGVGHGSQPQQVSPGETTKQVGSEMEN